MKLRGSWGKLGNQEIGNYAYAATLAASGSYYFGDSKQIGMKTAKIPNENIKWETTTITDFGFDAAFWGGKINVTFDWYEKNTSDILMKLAMRVFSWDLWMLLIRMRERFVTGVGNWLLIISIRKVTGHGRQVSRFQV